MYFDLFKAAFWAGVGAVAFLMLDMVRDQEAAASAKATFYSEHITPTTNPQYKVRTYEFHPKGAPDALCVIELDGVRNISCFMTR